METKELAPKQAEETEKEEVLEAQTEVEKSADQPEAKGEMLEQTETDATAEEAQVEQEDDLVIEFAGDSPTQEDEKEEAPQWVKDTRQKNRDLNKENRDLNKRIEELEGKSLPTETKLRAKPTLEGHLEDEDAYADDLEKWFGEKGADAAKRQTEIDSQKAVDEEVTGRIAKYDERKKAIGKSIPDYDEHVAEAEGALDDLQRNSIAYYFGEGAAEIMYYLGKKPDERKRIASITDPTEMLLAVGELKPLVKVSRRKPKTQPETQVIGHSKVIGKDVYLEQLENSKKAQDGDRTEINAYKREQREKARV